MCGGVAVCGVVEGGGVVGGGGGLSWFVVMTVSVLRYRSTTGRFCRYVAAVGLTRINRMLVVYIVYGALPDTRINRMLVVYIVYGALPDHVGPKHVPFNPSQILHRC